MKYNFITKLKNGKFSWKEDYRQTCEDLEPILNKTPFGWVTNKLEDKLGYLQLEDKFLIESIYTYSGLVKGLALYQYVIGDPCSPRFLLGVSLCGDLVGLLHHSAMGEKSAHPESSTENS